jgi:hypothetical protein
VYMCTRSNARLTEGIVDSAEYTSLEFVPRNSRRGHERNLEDIAKDGK